MGITREAVFYCYRHILGREPESEDVIAYFMEQFDSFRTLQEVFYSSEEYGGKQHGRRQYIILSNKDMSITAADSWYRLVDIFEGGADEAYLLNTDGKYMGKALRQENALLTEDRDAWRGSFRPADALTFTQNVENEPESLLQEAETYFNSHPGKSEILFVDSGGGSSMCGKDIRAAV